VRTSKLFHCSCRASFSANADIIIHRIVARIFLNTCQVNELGHVLIHVINTNQNFVNQCVRLFQTFVDKIDGFIYCFGLINTDYRYSYNNYSPIFSAISLIESSSLVSKTVNISALYSKILKISKENTHEYRRINREYLRVANSIF